jgi:NAD+ kinase
MLGLHEHNKKQRRLYRTGFCMSAVFKNIGIIGKFNDSSVAGVIHALHEFFTEKGCNGLVDANTAEVIGADGLPSVSREELGVQSDLVIVVGGDGTFLNAVRTLVDSETPLLGVNLGRLGFLTDINAEKMRGRLSEILAGEFISEKRFLLDGHFECETCGDSDQLAFNDIVVHKQNVARMIELDMYINGQYVNTQRADGLIASTPTGSTAYALSGGGPILHPTMDAVVMVPICPHTMSQRPIVVDGDSEIEIRVSDSNQGAVQATCDGQFSLDLNLGDSVRIRKYPTPVNLIHPADYNYYEILRQKLHWSHRL